MEMEMEDESEGWEIQEYKSSQGGDGKVIRRMLRMGKTIVVTGFMISSAPLVLPPLIVVSAVGLACSVPFGVFVASYACAEKLMSKLLPMPRPPPPLPLMLEYKGFGEVEEVQYLKFEGEGYGDGLVGETEGDCDSRIALQMSQDVVIDEGMDMEEEEKYRQDTKGTVEMRIALPVDEEREAIPEDKYDEGKAHREELKVEEGYEEDDETSLQEEKESTDILEEKRSGNEMQPLVEVIRIEKPADDITEYDQNQAHKMHEDFVNTDTNTASMAGIDGPFSHITTGAVGDLSGVGKESGYAIQGEQFVKDAVDLKGGTEEKRPITTTQENNGSQIAMGNRAIGVTDTDSQGKREMLSVTEKTLYTPTEHAKKNLESLFMDKEEKFKDNITVTEIVVETVDVSQGLQREKLGNLGNQHVAADASSSTKRKKKSKKKKGKSGEAAEEDIVFDPLPEENKGGAVSNADVREMADESGLNLVDEKNSAGASISSIARAADEVPFDKRGRTSRTPSGRSLNMPTNKALFSEEKIWEHIEALRTIVGYKVARHLTCIEELRALYIFTGVEPPVSFKDSPDLRETADLVEVNDKLQFLMAIVGVK